MIWDWSEKPLDSRTIRIQVALQTRRIGWAEVLALWTDSPSFADEFSAILAGSPFNAFRWETPCLRRQDLDKPFECVLVDDPDLPDHPDPSPFMEHLRNAGDRMVISFPNLGADAELIVPCPIVDDGAYTQLADFVRKAPLEQRRALWHHVGLAMERRVDDRPIWLSSAGGGVAWLHVRIDESPKYYAHAPYR